MNIDWINALAGGALIGISSGAFLILNGQIVGISGMVGRLTKMPGLGNINTQILFLMGLLLAPLAYSLVIADISPITITSSPILLVIGGLLVGFGTQIGKGCTSGHGVSGVSRFSLRSITATLIFLSFGILTQTIMEWLGIT